MSGVGETDGADEPVTVLVARRVRPGKEVEFETVGVGVDAGRIAFDGFLGAGLLRPGHVGELWHVVYRFASADELARWEQSPTRSELLAHGEQVMSTSHERRMTGLETWFEVPGRHRARTSPVEDVRGHLDRDLRAPVDAEPGAAPGGFVPSHWFRGSR